MAPTPDRVREERKQLTCSTCGAGNRLAPAVVERGFQRCSHCNSAMPVAGAGSFAVEHRGGGFTRVISPGRSVFILLLGRVTRVPFFLLYLVFGDIFTSILRRLGDKLGAPAALVWAPTVLFIAGAVFFLVRLLTQQRILATTNRVELSWQVFGLRLRHRRFGTHGLELELIESKWKGGLLARPRGQRPVLIRTEGSTEAETLRTELAEAIRETQVPIAADTVACPGCGAPVATPVQLIEKKGIECPHCGSGVVATEGGVVLGEATLSLAMRPVDEALKVNRRRTPTGTEWRLRPELLARPVTGIGMILAGFGCGGGMAVLGVFCFLEMAAFRAFGFIFAAVMVPLGLSLLVFMNVAAIGRHRVRLEAGVIEHEIRALGLRVRRKLIPLARIVDVNIRVTISSADWTLKTAVDEISMALPLLNGEGALVTEELFEGVAERLRAMERKVRIKRTTPPDPKKKRQET